MISIKVNISSIDETIEILKLLKDYKINVNFTRDYKPLKVTESKKENRINYWFNVISKYQKLTTGDLSRLKLKYKVSYKTMIRDLFELECKGLINLDLIDRKKGGFVYLITLNKKSNLDEYQNDLIKKFGLNE